MKGKLFLTVLALVVSSATFAEGFKGPGNKGGFSGPSQGINTVKKVLNAGMFSDDMPVTLTGKIKNHLGGEYYTFSDGTGDITVEIDHHKWQGQSVTPESKVELYGDIDKELRGVKVDVDVIRVLAS